MFNPVFCKSVSLIGRQPCRYNDLIEQCFPVVVIESDIILFGGIKLEVEMKGAVKGHLICKKERMLMWFDAGEHVTAGNRIFCRIVRVVGQIAASQIQCFRRGVINLNPSVPLSEIIHKVGLVHYHHLVDHPVGALDFGGTGIEQHYSDEKKQQLFYISHVHLHLKG